LHSAPYPVIALTADWTPRRSVALELDLPHDVAEEMERLQDRDPDLLGRMLSYAVLRAACYEGIRDGSRIEDSRKNT
jgi:hypothetical protein